MANTQTNLMLVNQLFSFNTGVVATGFKPGTPVGLLIVDTPTSFTEANMLTEAAFIIALNALCIKQGAAPSYARNGRGYAIFNLDGFKPGTKKTATKDTGFYQLKGQYFPQLWDFIVRGAQDNLSNYLNFLKMSNLPGKSVFVFDSYGNIWGTQSTTVPGEIKGFTLMQQYTDAWMPSEAGGITDYPISIHLANPLEFTQNFAYFQVPSLSNSALIGLENVVFQTAPAAVATAVIAAVSGDATKDIVILGKYGEGSADFFKDYGALITAPCFKAYNYGPTVVGALTISTYTYVPINVAGVLYNCGYIHTSAAVASGDKVQVSLTDATTVYGVISNYVVAEVVQAGVDGNNCAVKTF